MVKRFIFLINTVGQKDMKTQVKMVSCIDESKKDPGTIDLTNSIGILNVDPLKHLINELPIIILFRMERSY